MHKSCEDRFLIITFIFYLKKPALYPKISLGKFFAMKSIFGINFKSKYKIFLKTDGKKGRSEK